MTSSTDKPVSSGTRHPAEMILADVERIVEDRMGPRWRAYRDVADALGVLLHEIEADCTAYLASAIDARRG